jgi:hypothetical protein
MAAAYFNGDSNGVLPKLPKEAAGVFLSREMPSESGGIIKYFFELD